MSIIMLLEKAEQFKKDCEKEGIHNVSLGESMDFYHDITTEQALELVMKKGYTLSASDVVVNAVECRKGDSLFYVVDNDETKEDV